MEFLAELSKNGILALLLALSIAGLYRLYNDTKKLQEERVQDLKEINSALAQPLESVRMTVVRILETVTEKK